MTDVDRARAELCSILLVNVLCSALYYDVFVRNLCSSVQRQLTYTNCLRHKTPPLSRYSTFMFRYVVFNSPVTAVVQCRVWSYKHVRESDWRTDAALCSHLSAGYEMMQYMKTSSSTSTDHSGTNTTALMKTIL